MARPTRKRPLETLEHLAERANAGDEDALADLFEALLHPVIAFLRRATGCVDVAEDLAQEVMLRVYKNLHRFEPRVPNAFKAWLFSIARNLLHAHWGQKARGEATASLEDAPEPAGAEAAPEDLAMRNEFLDRFIRAFSRLSERDQTLLMLRYVAGHSSREIMEILGASSVVAVDKALSRARARLRRHLEDEGRGEAA